MRSIASLMPRYWVPEAGADATDLGADRGDGGSAQLEYQQSKFENLDVPQILFIDRVPDIPVATQRRVCAVQTVQLTVEILQVPFLGLVRDSPLLCIDRCVAYVLVVMQRQVLAV